MTGQPKSPAAYGSSAARWRQQLASALDRGDHRVLKQLLRDLTGEMNHEAGMLRRIDNGPLVDRLTEQARRLFQSPPTEVEALEKELAAERKLWADFRKKYRRAFVPEALHLFLSSTAVFLEPYPEGPQYDGFAKFFGRSVGTIGEVVTLFSRAPASGNDAMNAPVPPNFFAAYDATSGCFTVRRAYRTDLPRGAGEACIAEQLRTLIPNVDELRELVFDNVQNSATYDVFVAEEGGEPVVQQDVDPDDAPLVRLGKRVLKAVDRSAGAVRVSLDGFGFLDLHISAAR